MPETLTFKIAAEQEEFEQIHRLNYETFVEEIPQHQPGPGPVLVDKFHDENVYVICKSGAELAGMLAVRGERPFSLDGKVSDLDSYLPRTNSMCEIRLFSVRKAYRRSRVLVGLLSAATEYCEDKGYDLALISGTLRQQKLYRHMGFATFGPVVGTAEAPFQPMFLTIEAYRKMLKPVIKPKSDRSHKQQLNLLPGPVEIAREVRKAFNKPAISHRSQQFLQIHKDTKSLLCSLVNSKYVEIFMGSGTLANNVVAGQLSLRSGQGLILSNGEFGERLIDCAQRSVLAFETFALDWGKGFGRSDIRAIIRRSPGIEWLWAVHCETSTGMLNDIAMLKEVCEEAGILLCLDCVSSIGATNVNLENVYLASGVSGKGLRSYSGLSMVFYNHRPLPSGGSLPVYMDLRTYADKDGIPFTVSSNLVCALHESVKNLDIEKRITQTSGVSAWLKDELRGIGLEPVVADEFACPGVVTFCVPGKFSSEKIGAALEGKGCFLSYKSEYLPRRNWLQICLLGDFSREMLKPLLDDLHQILS